MLAKEIAENLASAFGFVSKSALVIARHEAISFVIVRLFMIYKARNATADCFVVPPRNDEGVQKIAG